MAKHTPGPWTHDNDGDWSLVSAGRETIAEVTSTMKDSDARLIAAAPDLLRELKRLVDALEPFEVHGGFPPAPGLATLNGARAAIAKAEGK